MHSSQFLFRWRSVLWGGALKGQPFMLTTLLMFLVCNLWRGFNECPLAQFLEGIPRDYEKTVPSREPVWLQGPWLLCPHTGSSGLLFPHFMGSQDLLKATVHCFWSGRCSLFSKRAQGIPKGTALPKITL